MFEALKLSRVSIINWISFESTEMCFGRVIENLLRINFMNEIQFPLSGKVFFMSKNSRTKTLKTLETFCIIMSIALMLAMSTPFISLAQKYDDNFLSLQFWQAHEPENPFQNIFPLESAKRKPNNHCNVRWNETWNYLFWHERINKENKLLYSPTRYSCMLTWIFLEFSQGFPRASCHFSLRKKLFKQNDWNFVS